MQGQFVSPADVQVPSSDEFVSAFGCDHNVEADCYHQYNFLDDHGASLKLTFGLVDSSFGLSLWQGADVVVKIYDEFLLGASIDETNQAVTVTLKKGIVTEVIRLNIWPKFFLSIETMR